MTETEIVATNARVINTEGKMVIGRTRLRWYQDV
jgi:hypothetical protein